MRAGLRLLVLVAACGLQACQDTPVVVSRSTAGAYEAALAAGPAGLAAAWYDERDGNAEIYLRRLDRSGRPAGPERRLTRTPEASYEASLAWLDGSLAVAWYERAHDAASVAQVGLVEADGSWRWHHTLPAPSRNPVVRGHEGTVFCAWIATDEAGGEYVWAGRWRADGRPLAGPTRLAVASATTWNLNAAFDLTGHAWVTFDAEASTTASELFVARLQGDEVRSWRLTRDDGRASKYPDLAFSRDGRIAVTWFDVRDGNREVYLLAAGPEAVEHGSIDGLASRVTEGPGASIGAYVAWNGDRIGLAWSDETPGQHEVFFQDFDADGIALGSARRLTVNATESLIPAIGAWHGGFALAWNEYAPVAEGEHGGASQIAFTIVP